MNLKEFKEQHKDEPLIEEAIHIVEFEAEKIVDGFKHIVEIMKENEAENERIKLSLMMEDEEERIRDDEETEMIFNYFSGSKHIPTRHDINYKNDMYVAKNMSLEEIKLRHSDNGIWDYSSNILHYLQSGIRLLIIVGMEKLLKVPVETKEDLLKWIEEIINNITVESSEAGNKRLQHVLILIKEEIEAGRITKGSDLEKFMIMLIPYKKDL